MSNNENKEIEAKFLEINKDDLIAKLIKLGARDLGEDLVKEIIFYDKEFKMRRDKQFVRLRQMRGQNYVTYKDHGDETVIDRIEEIGFAASDFDKARQFLQAVGLVAFRQQEKRRHMLLLDNATVDIDTWPNIPTYVEIESDAEDKVKKAALDLGFDWSKATFKSARSIIEQDYKIPVSQYRFFTFAKVG